MQIYIHIGPPKTGTSAIQNWCSRHQKVLLENAVYYPSHTLDENGISSGNLLSLFSKDSNNNLVYKEEKLLKETQRAKELGAKVIIFSSEFFFKQTEFLANAIPDAKFIAYIRFGLEQFESSYNQAVKRHGRTTEMSIPDYPKSQTLLKIQRIIDSFGESSKMILRAYGSSVFYKKNIITDFLSSIEEVDLSNIPVEQEERINSSYSHEGLQLKRWFNKFELGSLQGALDAFLQSQGEGAENYSLLDAEKFENAKESYLQQLASFCDNYLVTNGSALLRECTAKKLGKVKIQHISINIFSDLISKFIKKDKKNLNALILFLSENNPQNRGDFLRFNEIENLVTKNTSISDLSFLRSLPANILKKMRNALNKGNNEEGARFSELWDENTVVRVFDIPFSSDFFWLKSVKERDRGFWEFYYDGADGRNSKASNSQSAQFFDGNQIGHFSPDCGVNSVRESQEHVLFLQRPIDRFWLHMSYVLDQQTPKDIHQRLMAICEKHKVASLLSLAKIILTCYPNDYLCNVYSIYLKNVKTTAISTLVIKKGSEITVKRGCRRITEISSSQIEAPDVPPSLYELERLLTKDNEIFEKFAK